MHTALFIELETWHLWATTEWWGTDGHWSPVSTNQPCILLSDEVPMESSFNKSTMHSTEWWGTDGVQFQQINDAFYWVMRYRWPLESSFNKSTMHSASYAQYQF